MKIKLKMMKMLLLAAEQGEEIQLDPVGNLHMFKEALELDSPFVRRLQELFPNAAKTNGDNNIDSDLKHPTIEIRLRNVNYKVPIQVVRIRRAS